MTGQGRLGGRARQSIRPPSDRWLRRGTHSDPGVTNHRVQIPRPHQSPRPRHTRFPQTNFRASHPGKPTTAQHCRPPPARCALTWTRTPSSALSMRHGTSPRIRKNKFLNCTSRPDPETRKSAISCQSLGHRLHQQSGAAPLSFSAASDCWSKLNVDAGGQALVHLDSDTNRYIDLNDPTNPSTSAQTRENLKHRHQQHRHARLRCEFRLAQRLVLTSQINDTVIAVVSSSDLPAPARLRNHLIGAEMFFSSPATSLSRTNSLETGSPAKAGKVAPCHFKGLTTASSGNFNAGPRKAAAPFHLQSQNAPARVLTTQPYSINRRFRANFATFQVRQFGAPSNGNSLTQPCLLIGEPATYVARARSTLLRCPGNRPQVNRHPAREPKQSAALTAFANGCENASAPTNVPCPAAKRPPYRRKT